MIGPKSLMKTPKDESNHENPMTNGKKQTKMIGNIKNVMFGRPIKIQWQVTKTKTLIVALKKAVIVMTIGRTSMGKTIFFT